MDITTLFKACVKTVSLRNKDLGLANNIKSPLKTPRNKNLFNIKANTIVAEISKLKEILLKNRTAYLNLTNYLSSIPHMTDATRDEIDTTAENIMSTCFQLTKELKREIETSETSQQNLEHREILLLLVEEYLRGVCKIYSEQKAMRVKKVIKIRKISKLHSDTNLNNIKMHSTKEVKDNFSNDSSPLKIKEINGDVGTTLNEGLSHEEIQMLEIENEHLYNELNNTIEEIKQIESKVVHIAELQEMFTEKVLDQDKNLDRLMTTVVGSTENVKEANEQIREAIQRNAGMRVWILFFLLVMSFSLLFLDWYNP
ncbi:syntaxin-18 [Prorops nasuta]|uniref:syntaxin-18 n=1 Tax=Prorops nasuta TaxID=863751 RepID=UPI0034CEDEB0